MTVASFTALALIPSDEHAGRDLFILIVAGVLVVSFLIKAASRFSEYRKNRWKRIPVISLGFAPVPPPVPEPKIPEYPKDPPEDAFYGAAWTEAEEWRPKWYAAPEELPPREVLSLPSGTHCDHCGKLFVADSDGKCRNCAAPAQ